LLLAATILSGGANAGAWGLTHHSRANCAGFNETISWHLGHPYWLWVVSRHRGNGQDHQVIFGWAYIYRAPAYHFPEGKSGGWSVEGHHWMKASENSYPREVANEFVNDCSIYDGWWD